MPTISKFYGITVMMYNEKGGKHHLPHIHAEYQGEEVVIALNGDIIEGIITKRKVNLVLAWMEIHKEELEKNWKLLSAGDEYFKIPPLC